MDIHAYDLSNLTFNLTRRVWRHLSPETAMPVSAPTYFQWSMPLLAHVALSNQRHSCVLVTHAFYCRHSDISRLRVEGGAPYLHSYGSPQYSPDRFDTFQTYPMLCAC